MPNRAATATLVDEVLALAPRVAVFDCDGTLWSGDGGQDFLFWEIEQRLLPRAVADWVIPRYADYKAGKVDEETMCGEMVTVHAGIEVSRIEAAAEKFIEEVIAPRIFPEMLELTARLREAGCILYAVSSTNQWVIGAGARRFGISPQNIFAACVEIENGKASNRLIRVPTDEGKARVVRELLKLTPDAVFGNSDHDVAMLQLARHAIAVSPNAALSALAIQHGWRTFWPASGA